MASDSDSPSEIGLGDYIHDILHEYGNQHRKPAGYDHYHNRKRQLTLEGPDIMSEPLKLL